MNFTPLEDVRSKGRLYDEGNRYDSEKHDIPDEDVERWYTNGWVTIEGREPPPARQVRGAEVQPENSNHQHKESPHA